MKSKEELLKQFRKANQAYKLQLSLKAGFKNATEYLTYLTNGVGISISVIEPLLEVTHIVDILDASGSMRGGKYENSKEGIKKSLESLSKDNSTKLTYTLVEFVDDYKTKNHFFLEELPKYSSIQFNGAFGSNTPLYYTVWDVLSKLRDLIKKEEKTLVRVYTDGFNNSKSGYNRQLTYLINDLKDKGFTVTFVATQQDLRGIQMDLGLDESNTLAVTDDAFGFQQAFGATIAATEVYRSRVSKGMDVSNGFYKRKGSL